ncbi:hypothetical protein [uncultured Chryseobacterium sp.]|uniref:hypothetical protein n=1 Tax=uncultured Chryseobacterium sp. TaxID=259322 RepID=UPI0025DDD1ED|nr:hypothetical protein [uncultured Chryseobacterium sp.]
MNKNDLKRLVVEALEYYKGKANIVEICKFICSKYNQKLADSGDLLYTWQYDMRWAGTQLIKEGIMKPAKEQVNNHWELVQIN